MNFPSLLAALTCASTGLALAQGGFLDESGIELKDGQGKDVVAANCNACHSLDYIPMNSPFLDRKGWEASVNKMIKVMGAPIRDEDVPIIVNYLSTQYGNR